MAKLRLTRHDLIILLLLTGPYFLNDFTNIFFVDWASWLFCDYVFTKLLPGLVVFYLLRHQELTLTELGLISQPVGSFAAVFIVTALITVIIDQNAYSLLAELPGYQPLGGIPAITSPFWKWFDLSIGLLLVGIFEELIFRGYMLSVIRRFTDNPIFIVISSSLFFGLIHWSLGLHAVLITAVIGVVFMLAYLWTKSLPAIMLAHFLVNFIDFAGVIPRSLFRVI